MQEGTGDPSPDNVRPISGWAGLTGQRTGKNLLPNNLVNGTIDGVLYTKNSDDSISVSGTATNVSIKVISTIKLPAGSYTVNGGVTSASISVRKGKASGAQLAASSGSDVKFTLSEATTLAVVIRVANGTTVSETVYPMIRLVSESDSTFEPYTSDTISVNWQDTAGTVYGGEDEVISGKLSSNMGAVDLGSATWLYVAPYFRTEILDAKIVNALGQLTTEVLASEYKAVQKLPQNLQNGEFCVSGTQYSDRPYLCIRDDRFSDAAVFKEAMAGQTALYTLAEPVEYTLTENEIIALDGTNVIWANTGDVTVTYIAKSAKFSFGSPLHNYNYNNLKLFGNTYIEHGKG